MHKSVPVPDHIGDHGRAWRCNRAAALRRLHWFRTPIDAVIADWIVEVPDASRSWHSYHIALLHLRPLRGVPAPVLYLPGATHELQVMALHAGADCAAAIAGHLLADRLPLAAATFAAQLVEPTDQAATIRTGTAIDLILSGDLDPESRAHWVSLFGRSMDLSAQPEGVDHG
jgi:hypothetical protein